MFKSDVEKDATGCVWMTSKMYSQYQGRKGQAFPDLSAQLRTNRQILLVPNQKFLDISTKDKLILYFSDILFLI